MASLNDQKVLAFMFDPFLLDAMNNEEDKPENDSTSESELTGDQIRAKQLELKAIEEANAKKFDESLVTFGESLFLWPDRASTYNNRAQVYRLQNQIKRALSDLDRAISLSDGENVAQNDKLVARQAYCQRALIHLLQENKEQGLSDMNKAAVMGNGFAKSYMAQQNPYAALCNQMLKEMFEQYRVPSNTATNGH